MPSRARKSSFTKMATLNFVHASDAPTKNVECEICHKSINWNNSSKSCGSCNTYFCS